MKKINLVFILAIACALFVCASGVVSATTYYVPDNHEKIQWAVDNASAGDTIIVRDGTYTENVDVNKRLTIRSENGSANCIVQAAITDFPVFEVTADYVNISGFTVKDATGDVEESGFGGTGIALNSVSHCNVSDNIAVNNTAGIGLFYSNYSIIENNTCDSNSFGIGLGDANNNTLISNIFVNNGLFVWYSHDNIVEDNTVNGKPLVYLEGLSDAAVTDDAGQVILVNCNNITVQGKDLSYAGVGIELWETNDSTISNNIASNNNLAGIFILGSNNILKDNNASNNHFGIAVFSGLFNDIVSVNNIIENNTANNNAVEGYPGSSCGIRLDASHNIVRENKVSGNIIGIGVGSGPDSYILINNTISCNHATDNIYGIVFINSSYSVVENNIASNNSRFGIFLSSSSNSTITNNTVEFNNDCGINVLNSSNNTVTANTASSNNGSGIRICESERDIISNNLALNNSWGISLQYCNNSVMSTFNCRIEFG